MKKILFASLISFLMLGSCQSSSEEKAKELIKHYIKENSNDPDSYEPIQFGALENDDEASLYKYKMNHKFRANNAFGAKITQETTFYITEDLKFAEPKE